jgi:hypothetical protein
MNGDFGDRGSARAESRIGFPSSSHLVRRCYTLGYPHELLILDNVRLVLCGSGLPRLAARREGTLDAHFHVLVPAAAFFDPCVETGRLPI